MPKIKQRRRPLRKLGRLRNTEATPETLAKARANPDPIFVLAKKRKLHSGLEDKVDMIRSACRYLESQTGFQVSDYLRAVTPTGPTVVDAEREPPEVKRYLAWSALTISRFGYSGFSMVRAQITIGQKCPDDLFLEAVEKF